MIRMMTKLDKQSILMLGKEIVRKFNQELEKRDAEIEALKGRVFDLEAQISEVYRAWARYNCCGRHD